MLSYLCVPAPIMGRHNATISASSAAFLPFSISAALRSSTDCPGRLLNKRFTGYFWPTAKVSTRAKISANASGSADGMATGTPGYQTLMRGDGYSLRLYDSHFVVRTSYVRRDEGFDALGGYMDGRNEAAARLPAPQPVIMTYFPDGRKFMQLFVPTPKSGGLPPQPTVPGVTLEVAGGKAMAAVAFTGYATKEAAAKAQETLVAALKRDGLLVAEGGEFLVAQYGPLFSLSTRINELLMPIQL